MVNGTQFSYSVQQNRRREENPNAMEGNKCKVNTQRRKVKENTGKSGRNFPQ